jgi:L-alanine-DL-glutamate epimerase-like enolase superfamily enzyme
MKIRRIEPIAIRIPMKKPVIMAGVEIRVAENVLVRVETDDGSIGWGEAASAPTMTGETIESMLAAIAYLSPALLGQAADDIGRVLAALDARMYGNYGAKAAIEIALHDLIGRATGRPACELLGGKQRNRMRLMAVIGTGDIAADLKQAESYKAQGYAAFKIKVGVDQPLRDAERTRAICERIGAGSLISADANQGYSTQEAVHYVQALAASRLDFLEQPVRGGDVAGMAEVASAAGDIAIGVDEGIHSLNDIRVHHEASAARGASLKTIKLRGMRGVLEAGRLCDSLGMKVNVAAKTGESSIACAAAVHVAAALPQIDWGLTLTHQGLADDLTARPIAIAGGHVDALNGPGLGIDVDEERVRRYRCDLPVRQVA